MQKQFASACANTAGHPPNKDFESEQSQLGAVTLQKRRLYFSTGKLSNAITV